MTDPAQSKPPRRRGRRRRRIRAHPAAAIAPSRDHAGGRAARVLPGVLRLARPALRAVVGRAARAGLRRAGRSPAARRRRASRTATSASRARPTARARSSWTRRGRGCSASSSACSGTGDRLFVHRLENPLPADRAEADVFEGRLIRIDDLPYADAIRGYFAKHVTATHYFATDAALKALAARAPGAPLSIVDRGGDKASLAADEALAIEVVRPGRGADRPAALPLPDRGRGARRDHVARRRGGRREGPGEGAGAARARARRTCSPRAPEPPSRWTFVVRFPAARRQAALDELGDVDRTVEIRDAREIDRGPRERAGRRQRRAGRARARRARSAGWPPPTSPPFTRWRRS